MKTQIISAVQQKGGAGKTSTLIAIGLRMINDGAKIAFIDTDESENLLKWCKLQEKTRLDFDYCAIKDKTKVTKTINDLSDKGYDALLVDTGGYESQISLYVIMSSDLVIIPTMTDELSSTGAIITYRNVQSVEEVKKEKIKTFVLFSHVDIRSNFINSFKTLLKNKKIPFLNSPFGSATGMKLMLSTGLEPKDVTSKKYIDSVMCELQMKGMIYFYKMKEVA